MGGFKGIQLSNNMININPFPLFPLRPQGTGRLLLGGWDHFKLEPLKSTENVCQQSTPSSLEIDGPRIFNTNPDMIRAMHMIVTRKLVT